MRCRDIIATGILTVFVPLSAGAAEWGNAPLACLPARAERWKIASEMQPCHCPPQDFCPKPITIEAKDISITVSLNMLAGRTVAYQFSAADFGMTSDEAKSLFTMSADEIALKINKPPLQNYVNDIVDKSGEWSARDISISLAKNLTGLDAWKNDTLDMPVGLASRCCDSICPEGTLPTTTQTTVYAYDGVATAGMQTAISDTQAAYDAAVKDLNDWNQLLFVYLAGGGKLLPAQVIITQQRQAAVDTAKANLDKANTNLQGQATSTYVLDVVTCRSAEKHFLTYREGCILEGTEIVLADGSKAPIETLRVGSKLKGQKGVTTVKAINRFTQKKDTLYGINGGAAFISPEHPVLTVAGWKSINPKITSVRSDLGTVGLLVVGDEIVSPDGTVKVESIDKHVREDSSVLNLALDGDGTFIANGVVVHGFDHVQIHY